MWLCATYPFVAVGSNLSIHYTCRVDRAVSNQIRLGNSVLVGKDTWLNVISDPGPEARIVIDDNVGIGGRCQISAKNLIHLERDVIVAASVLIMDHNHAYEDIDVPIRDQGVTAGGIIRIEQGSWIGQGASIVCNEGELVIGRNSVIGANALVTRSVPPYSVFVGNPGRIARQYDPVKRTWVMGSVRSMDAEFVKSR
jgi:acetyltransferase-like isoleucine patch superfamily enzyme